MRPNPETNHESDHAPAPELKTQERAAIVAAQKQITDRLDYALSHSGDYGLITQSNLRASFQQKADTLMAETETFKEEVGVEMENVILGGLMNRLDLILRMGGKDVTVSSFTDLAKLDQGIAIIRSTDVQGLVVDYLKNHRPELLNNYLRHLGRKVEPDVVELLKKMDNGKELEAKDWEVMVHYGTEIASNRIQDQQKSMVMALIAGLKPGDRLVLANKMAAAKPAIAHFNNFLESITASGYLTIDQAQECLRKNPNILRIYPDLLNLISGPEMQKRQEAVEAARTDAVSRMTSGISFGQRNSARELLTFKGIGSAAVAANGMLTILANIAVDLKDPSAIPTNPGFLLGVAQLGIGLELSNGMAGLAPQPTKLFAAVTTDKGAEKSKEFVLKEEALMRSFGRYTSEAKFYYTMADKIVEKYGKNKDIQRTTRPKITMEDLGLKWAELPKEYTNGKSKADFEARISEWAGNFAQDIHTESVVSQQAKIEDSYCERMGIKKSTKSDAAITTYELDPILNKLKTKS